MNTKQQYLLCDRFIQNSDKMVAKDDPVIDLVEEEEEEEWPEAGVQNIGRGGTIHTKDK